MSSQRLVSRISYVSVPKVYRFVSEFKYLASRLGGMEDTPALRQKLRQKRADILTLLNEIRAVFIQIRLRKPRRIKKANKEAYVRDAREATSLTVDRGGTSLTVVDDPIVFPDMTDASEFRIAQIMDARKGPAFVAQRTHQYYAGLLRKSQNSQKQLRRSQKSQEVQNTHDFIYQEDLEGAQDAFLKVQTTQASLRKSQNTGKQLRKSQKTREVQNSKEVQKTQDFVYQEDLEGAQAAFLKVQVIACKMIDKYAPFLPSSSREDVMPLEGAIEVFEFGAVLADEKDLYVYRQPSMLKILLMKFIPGVLVFCCLIKMLSDIYERLRQ